MGKITLFICSLSSGGAEHQLVQLANMLVEKGRLVTVATFADLDDHYTFDDRIKRHRIGAHRSSLVRFLMIFWYFLTIRTHCVISFGQRENAICLLPLLFRPDIRVIAGERNFTVGKPSRYEKILTKFLYRRATYVVPNSYSQRDYLVRKFPYLKGKTVTITNYTDVEEYCSMPIPLNEPRRLVIFARYCPQKNGVRFVEAVKIASERTKKTFVVDWYGNIHNKNGECQDEYVKMKELIERYGLDDVLKLNNHVKDVRKVLLKYDVACLPSLHEGFSNAISEAICCGRPVLASEVSDNHIMVHDGENGFLFNPLSPENIAERLLKFLDLSNEKQIEMGVRSRKIAETLFQKKLFFDSYIHLIEA